MDPHRVVIESYFKACSMGDASLVAEHFTEDARVFDVNIAPLEGRRAIGEFWVKVADRWGAATWQVDTCIEEFGAAAIEWTMRGLDRHGRSVQVRGSEHYLFRGRLISEIRQYWKPLGGQLSSGLIGYDPSPCGVNKEP